MRFDSGITYDSGARYDQPDTPTIIKKTHMIDLHKFFINPFDDGNISMDELLSFSTDHIQRLAANNPGGNYTARITATTAAVGVVNDTFTDDQTKLGVRMARKQAKNAFRQSVPKNVGRLAVAVEAQFGERSPEFTECFPHGRSLFSSCGDDQLGNHLQALLTALTVFETQLGAPVITDATALLTGWNAVYVPSESSTGEKTTTQLAKNNARAALQLELFKNLLTLALDFPRQPEMLSVYLQPSLLADHPPAPPAPPPPPTP